jgi:hypothetical protein
MWERFGRNGGIIQSTTDKLVSELGYGEFEHVIYAATWQQAYEHYNREPGPLGASIHPWNARLLLRTKLPKFADETEVRLIYPPALGERPQGRYLNKPVKLQRVIDALYLSPTLPKEFGDLLTRFSELQVPFLGFGSSPPAPYSPPAT